MTFVAPPTPIADGPAERGVRSVAEPASPAYRYLFGLRVGVTAVAATLLLTMSMLRNIGSYDPAWTQPLAWSVLAAVVGAGAVLVARRRDWGPARVVAITATLGASTVSMLGLPDGAATTAADWSTGVVGWVGLVVLFGRPLAVVVAFLAVHEAMALADVMITRRGDVDALLNAVSGAIGTIGYPLAAAIAATALGRAAHTVQRSWHEQERLRTEEAIAARLHDHRRERFAVLDDGVLPLLRGLRDAELDPAHPEVRRTCSIEAARLRRMFAESEEATDPLLNVVRHCVDVAERRQIVVELQIGGHWPDPPPDVRRGLTDGLLVVVSTATGWARVTLMGADGVLTVGAVADCGDAPVTAPGTEEVVVDTIREGNLLWVQARWVMPSIGGRP